MKLFLYTNLILANIFFIKNIGNNKFKGYLGLAKAFSNKYSYFIEFVDAKIKDTYILRTVNDNEFTELISFIYESNPKSLEEQNLKQKFIKETKVILYAEFSYEYTSMCYFVYTFGKEEKRVYNSFLTSSFIIDNSRQFYNVVTLKNKVLRRLNNSLSENIPPLKNLKTLSIKEAFRKLIYDKRSNSIEEKTKEF